MTDCKRYDARNDANQREIVEALEKFGCTVYLIKRPVDLLVGRNNCNILMEVKTENGKLNPKQKDFFDTWKGQKSVVRTVDEAIALVEQMTIWRT